GPIAADNPALEIVGLSSDQAALSGGAGFNDLGLPSSLAVEGYYLRLVTVHDKLIRPEWAAGSVEPSVVHEDADGQEECKYQAEAHPQDLVLKSPRLERMCCRGCDRRKLYSYQQQPIPGNLCCADNSANACPGGGDRANQAVASNATRQP